jgi:hypothetical protein
MPAKSIAQREAIAIAEHHPDQLYARNKGLTEMTHQQQHEFASTPEKHLPVHVSEHKPHREHVRLHATKRGHGGRHAEAYISGAMAQRHGMHSANHPRTAASGLGYSGTHASAYMEGAQNEADGMHESDVDEADA